ncbi:MarR family winged helix-turn-helix transcriptional regulator [Acidaminococcus fermentans]|uniref:MarR family winged helix-turn-helix transcriptional regulator n=1 Tax=Acidaminococcus fermentans TaxID=905 RepID=UPI000D0F80F4|nr:MarR family transcriptional regulator [Acidaminococcus fermentans]
MELALTKRFLLACQEAKTIVERQPRLPRGMKPGHVRVLDTLHQLEEQQDQVRAGDVGRAMGITPPSITRLTHELVEMGCVEQQQLPEDRRVWLVKLTPRGEQIYDYYVRQFHQWLNGQMEAVSPADLEAAIRVIHQTAAIMEKVPEQFVPEEKGGDSCGK